jgi:very-short-patch-repair endonuclease
LGLSEVLEPQQLEECRSSWLRQVQEVSTAAARASKRQRVVYALLQELPLQWQQDPAVGETTEDGCFSIDIAAVTAKGTKLAIEVDGPGHYLRPGYWLDGPTKARDLALKARGYKVISIPYYEWRKLNTEQQRRYLLSKVVAAD